MTRCSTKPLFAGLVVAGMLLLYLGDTDQDGSTDKQEVDVGTKFLDSASHPGATNDQAPGGQGQNRADADQDGLFDDDEANNPND